LLPFEAIPITIWNDSTSAITTLTIYGTTTGGGVPNNDDIWVEVEYLGSALTPAGLIHHQHQGRQSRCLGLRPITARMHRPGAAVAQATASRSWCHRSRRE
jgi:hypothetical protein